MDLPPLAISYKWIRALQSFVTGVFHLVFKEQPFCSTHGHCVPLHGRSTFHCMGMPHAVIGAFPLFSYDKECCCEHSRTMKPEVLISRSASLTFTVTVPLSRTETLFGKCPACCLFDKFYATQFAEASFDLYVASSHSDGTFVGFVLLQNNMQLTFVVVVVVIEHEKVLCRTITRCGPSVCAACCAIGRQTFICRK